MTLMGAAVVAAIFLAFFLFQKAGQISPAQARQYCKEGAKVIDVRTPGEFHSGHLPGAQNIPLDELEAAAPKLLPNQEQVLLLHCQSGMRSGMARKKLQALGYAQVFNLGSYGRAQEIVRSLTGADG